MSKNEMIIRFGKLSKKEQAYILKEAGKDDIHKVSIAKYEELHNAFRAKVLAEKAAKAEQAKAEEEAKQAEEQVTRETPKAKEAPVTEETAGTAKAEAKVTRETQNQAKEATIKAIKDLLGDKVTTNADGYQIWKDSGLLIRFRVSGKGTKIGANKKAAERLQAQGFTMEYHENWKVKYDVQGTTIEAVMQAVVKEPEAPAESTEQEQVAEA